MAIRRGSFIIDIVFAHIFEFLELLDCRNTPSGTMLALKVSEIFAYQKLIIGLLSEDTSLNWSKQFDKSRERQFWAL